MVRIAIDAMGGHAPGPKGKLDLEVSGFRELRQRRRATWILCACRARVC